MVKVRLEFPGITAYCTPKRCVEETELQQCIQTDLLTPVAFRYAIYDANIPRGLPSQTD